MLPADRLAALIEAERRRLGMTQAAAASAAGMTRRTWQRIEAGEEGQPEERRRAALAMLAEAGSAAAAAALAPPPAPALVAVRAACFGWLRDAMDEAPALPGDLRRLPLHEAAALVATGAAFAADAAAADAIRAHRRAAP